IKISGMVKDSATGESLSGVTIRVKGASKGTVTNAEGQFSLDITKEDAVLVVSFVGYGSKEIPVNGRSDFNILLSSAATGLDQLVVVGYGTQKKENLTGSVATVKMDHLVNVPTGGLNEVLGGRAAGVHVTNTSGAPGASSVKIGRASC